MSISRLTVTSCLGVLVVATASCAKSVQQAGDRAHRPPARYLFAWSGDEGREESDFLAVVDLAMDGDRYGTIVATSPVEERGLWPHHTEHELSAKRTLFANGYSSNHRQR